MTRRCGAGLVLTLTLLLVLSAAAAPACEQPAALSDLRTELLTLANAERASAALPPLRADARLDAAAQAQACHTAGRERLTHRGRWLAGLGRRLRREGYALAMAAENLAAGQNAPAAVVADWMDSAGHRQNLLDPRAREAGFGVARAGDGALHWVMIAAARG